MFALTGRLSCRMSQQAHTGGNDDDGAEGGERRKKLRDRPATSPISRPTSPLIYSRASSRDNSRPNTPMARGRRAGGRLTMGQLVAVPGEQRMTRVGVPLIDTPSPATPTGGGDGYDDDDFMFGAFWCY